MFIDLQSLLRRTRSVARARRSAAARRRREDRMSQARLVPPPSPYSSGFVNELGSWCGVGQSASRRGTTYIWIPWDTAQIRRFR
jgi:hypothetical protein